MNLQKKSGVNGWPRPQADQIACWCERYGIAHNRRDATSGSIYLTIQGEDTDEIVIRCADHADAHCTATYTVDPYIDQRASVKTWIKAHGDDSAARQATARKRKYNRLIKQAGDYALTADGEIWYRWTSQKTITHADLQRVRHQIQHGYAADALTDGWLKLT